MTSYSETFNYKILQWAKPCAIEHVGAQWFIAQL
jgi:hypothetical protein